MKPTAVYRTCICQSSIFEQAGYYNYIIIAGIKPVGLLQLNNVFSSTTNAVYLFMKDRNRGFNRTYSHVRLDDEQKSPPAVIILLLIHYNIIFHAKFQIFFACSFVLRFYRIELKKKKTDLLSCIEYELCQFFPLTLLTKASRSFNCTKCIIIIIMPRAFSIRRRTILLMRFYESEKWLQKIEIIIVRAIISVRNNTHHCTFAYITKWWALLLLYRRTLNTVKVDVYS